MKRKNEIDHWKRKNPKSAEIYRKQRHERNRKRGKQVWVGGDSIAEGGHWERITATSEVN